LVLKEHGAVMSTIREEAPSIMVKQKGAVVQERIHHIEEEDIQPVIHLQREKTEIVHVTQPIKETQVLPTTIHQRELPSEFRPDVVIPGQTYARREVFPTVEYAQAERVQVLKPPIVEEVVKKNIIEEITPVVTRDVYQPHVIKERKDIYEKVIEAPVYVEQTRGVIDKGVFGSHNILTPKTFNANNGQYIVQQNTTTTTTTTGGNPFETPYSR